MRRTVALALLASGVMAGAAVAQTYNTLVPAPAAPAPAAPAPNAAPRPAPPVTPSPGPKPQPASASKANAQAEAMRRATDERLKRRDAAARRAMQGICKGC